MIRLKPVCRPDGALVRILGNVARGLLVLLCLVAWMPSPATASQPATPTLNSVLKTANLGELKVTWSWTDNSTDSCPMSSYLIYYKKTTGVTWDFIYTDIGNSNYKNNANRGLFTFSDITTNERTSVSSKSKTIGSGMSGEGNGETGVSLESASYDIKMEVYSDNGNCDFPDGQPLGDDEDNYSEFSNEISATPNTAPKFASNASIANQSLVQDSAMTDLTLPAATGGNGTLSYSLSPMLPTGLSFTASTRVLSGTPTVASTSATYTYTVSDTDNDTASLTFTIAVVPKDTTAPAFGDDKSIANQSLVQNMAMTDVTLPEAEGGDGILSYSLSPTLPAGLSFTASTRVLSGTPTGTSASATYTYTVSDEDNITTNDEDTLTFTIAVAADTVPAFAGVSIANLSLLQNSAMTSVTLPTATGGNGSLSYSLSPATLPAGLSFNTGTRVLSGTPTAAQGGNHLYLHGVGRRQRHCKPDFHHRCRD